MKKFVARAALALMVLAQGAIAGDVVVPGVLDGFPTPPSWRLTAAGVSFDSESAYVWVDAEGNCRMEHRQECYPGHNGQIICRTISEWKCDRDTAFYRLPDSVSVDTDAKRCYYTAADGSALTIGKVKSFLWSKWIKLFDGADLSVTHDSAALTLDPDALADSLRADQFEQLYDVEAPSAQ